MILIATESHFSKSGIVVSSKNGNKIACQKVIITGGGKDLSGARLGRQYL